MRKLLICFLMLFPCMAFGQSTSVTATITDTNGQAWINGSVTATFVPGPVNKYQWPGGAIPNQVIGQMDGSGTFTISLPDNSTITPIGSGWKFTLCSNTSAPCVTGPQMAVSGASMNLSTQLSAIATVPKFPATAWSYGYSDSEVWPIPVQGGMYWNVITLQQRCWTGSTWIVCSSNGGSNLLLQHNGTDLTDQTLLNFNDTTPAAPSGYVNVTFDPDNSGDLSAYVPILSSLINWPQPTTSFSSGATTITVSSSAYMRSAEGIIGPGIASGTTISSINSSTSITLSLATTANETNVTLTPITQFCVPIAYSTNQGMCSALQEVDPTGEPGSAAYFYSYQPFVIKNVNGIGAERGEVDIGVEAQDDAADPTIVFRDTLNPTDYMQLSSRLFEDPNEMYLIDGAGNTYWGTYDYESTNFGTVEPANGFLAFTSVDSTQGEVPDTYLVRAAEGELAIGESPSSTAIICVAGSLVSGCSGSGVTWPTSADIVISNATNSPAGLAPVNGDCVVGSGGAWIAGSCGAFPTGMIGGAAYYTGSSGAISSDVLIDQSSIPLQINAASLPTQMNLTYNSGHAPSGVSGSAAIAPDSSGNLDDSENGGSFYRICNSNNYTTACPGTTYTGTSPIVVSGTAISCPTCSTGTGTNVEINGGSALGTANFNGTTPTAGSDFLNVVWQNSGSDVSAEVPYATSSTFGVVEPDNSTVTISAGVISAVAASPGTVTYTSNQTASTSDNGKLVIMDCGSACAYTLPSTQPSTTWSARITSQGSTVATIVLGGSDTFNGNTAVPVLNEYRILSISANSAVSTDYSGDAPLVAGSNVSFTPATNGMTLAAVSGGLSKTYSQATTSYTLQASDANTLIFSNESAQTTYTIPAAGSTGFGAGATFYVYNNGTSLTGNVYLSLTSTSSINGNVYLDLPSTTGAIIVSTGSTYNAIPIIGLPSSSSAANGGQLSLIEGSNTNPPITFGGGSSMWGGSNALYISGGTNVGFTTEVNILNSRTLCFASSGTVGSAYAGFSANSSDIAFATTDCTSNTPKADAQFESQGTIPINSSGTAPTCAAQTGAGSGATCSMTGTDQAGTLVLTTGTSPTSASEQVVVTFNVARKVAPWGCQVQPTNAAAATDETNVYTTAGSTTTWSVSSGASALAASTAHDWSYICM